MARIQHDRKTAFLESKMPIQFLKRFELDEDILVNGGIQWKWTKQADHLFSRLDYLNKLVRVMNGPVRVSRSVRSRFPPYMKKIHKIEMLGEDFVARTPSSKLSLVLQWRKIHGEDDE
ncbi:hypothetical protein LguiA_017745 [Lonicera macranthoides]